MTLAPLRLDEIGPPLAVERAIAGQDAGRPDAVLRERLMRWTASADAARPAGTWTMWRGEDAIGRIAVDRPDGCGYAWLSYALAPDARGRGLATEAATAMLVWIVEHGGVTEVRALIRLGNDASIAVARRLGMTRHSESDAQNHVFAVRTFLPLRHPA